MPASRFRVEQLVPHLKARGIDCTVRPAYGEAYNRVAHRPVGPLYKLACSLQRFPFALDAHRFDLVVLQRPALPFSAAAERFAIWRNPRAIFDVDDAIFTNGQGRPIPRHHAAFEAIVGACAHVVCGNEFLADHTRSISPTTVIPTVVDASRYRPGPTTANEEAPTVVGWMGTSSNFEHLALIAPVLERLVHQRPRVVVRLVSDREFEPLAGVAGVEQLRWDPRREVDHLQSFDIGVMPLLDHRSARGKCALKALQYMAVAIPVVASSVGVNQKVLADGDGGILAESPRAFEAALLRLLDDPALRRSLGARGRDKVLRDYSVDAVIDRYVELFEAVAHGRSPAGARASAWPAGAQVVRDAPPL